jgi:hypothetical protein
MKETGVIFQGWGVRSIQDDLKTMTRRTKGLKKINENPDEWEMLGHGYLEGSLCFLFRNKVTEDSIWIKCPYGDRIWVRESGVLSKPYFNGQEGLWWTFKDGSQTFSSGYASYIQNPPRTDEWWKKGPFKLTPSIHMPRWASRLTLEIVSVRPERMKEISPEDCIKEGLKCLSKDQGRTYKYGMPDRDGWPGGIDDGWPWHEWRISPVDAYERIWTDINGAGSWEKNPWVWAIEFKRIVKEVQRDRDEPQNL